MRRLTYLGALALMLAVLIAPSAGATGAGATGGQQTGTIVYIRDFYFSPAKIAVEPGTTVTWVNLGLHPHTVTSFDGQFDSGTLWPGESYTVKFIGHGTLGYYCAIHPSMTGSVGVGTPAASGGASTMGGGTMGGGSMDGGGGGQPMPMPSRY